MSDSQAVDVAIIGAGIAGLCAARALKRAGRSVCVIEARNRAGGRTLGARLLGEAVDVGGQWAGPTQTRLLRLLDELQLKTYPQFADGKRLLELNGRLRPYSGTIPRLPLFSLIELGLALGRINRMARGINPETPWTADGAAELDLKTAREWMHGRVRTRSARALMDIAARAIFSAELHELSALHFLNYVRNAGRFEALAEIHGDGAQQIKVHGGMFQLAQRLAAGLGEHEILLSAPASAVEQNEAGVVVTHARGRSAARFALLALPPPLCAGIGFAPVLPAARQQLALRMPMGSVIKVLVAYPRPFWRERGFSGEAISDAGPLSPVMDAGIPGRSEGVLVGFLEAAQAQPLLVLSEAERRSVVVACLTRYFGPEAAAPLAYTEHDWTGDPWSRGCYAALATPGVWTQLGPALREPVGRIHWAGTETATAWLGYIEGAIQSGLRASEEIGGRLA